MNSNQTFRHTFSTTKVSPGSAWLTLDDSVQDALLELGKKDLVQDEIDNVQSLLQKIIRMEEILNEVRLNIYPEEKVLRQVQNIRPKKRSEKKQVWFISGLIQVWFAFVHDSLYHGFGLMQILMLVTCHYLVLPIKMTWMVVYRTSTNFALPASSGVGR